MSSEPENPPAFPHRPYQNQNGEAWSYGELGMSLRDYFAAAALQSLRPVPVEPELGESVRGMMEWNAKWAYTYADAMLRARIKK